MAAQCSDFLATLAREALAQMQPVLMIPMREPSTCAVDYMFSLHGVRQALSIAGEALVAHADETEAKASRVGMKSCMQS